MCTKTDTYPSDKPGAKTAYIYLEAKRNGTPGCDGILAILIEEFGLSPSSDLGMTEEEINEACPQTA